MKHFLIFAFALFLFVGCVDTNLPHCSDSLVDSKLKDVFIQEFKVVEKSNKGYNFRPNIITVWSEFSFFYDDNLGMSHRIGHHKYLRLILADSAKNLNLIIVDKDKNVMRLASNFSLIADIKWYKKEDTLEYYLLKKSDEVSDTVSVLQFIPK